MEDFDINSEFDEFTQELEDAEMMNDFTAFTEEAKELIFEDTVSNHYEDSDETNYETPIDVDEEELKEIDQSFDKEKEEEAFNPPIEDDFFSDMGMIEDVIALSDLSESNDNTEVETDTEIKSEIVNAGQQMSIEDEDNKNTESQETIETPYAFETEAEKRIRIAKEKMLARQNSTSKAESSANTDIHPKEEKKAEFNSINNDLSTSLSQRRRNTESKTPFSRRQLAKKQQEDTLKFEKQRQTVNEIKRAFAIKQAEKTIDDIIMSVERFTKDGTDITESAQREIEANKLQTALIDKKQETQEQFKIEQSQIEETSISTKTELKKPDPNNKPDKYNEDVFDNEVHVKKREYTNGEAPKETIIFAEPKEINEDAETKGIIVFLVLLDIVASIYVSIKANSYCNYTKGRTHDVIDCVRYGLMKDVPLSLDPINTNIVFPIIIAITAIMCFFGWIKLSDAKEKRKARVGHEHGNAKFGTKKDFENFKNQFMDMS